MDRVWRLHAGTRMPPLFRSELGKDEYSGQPVTDLAEDAAKRCTGLSGSELVDCLRASVTDQGLKYASDMGLSIAQRGAAALSLPPEVAGVLSSCLGRSSIEECLKDTATHAAIDLALAAAGVSPLVGSGASQCLSSGDTNECKKAAAVIAANALCLSVTGGAGLPVCTVISPIVGGLAASVANVVDSILPFGNIGGQILGGVITGITKLFGACNYQSYNTIWYDLQEKLREPTERSLTVQLCRSMNRLSCQLGVDSRYNTFFVPTVPGAYSTWRTYWNVGDVPNNQAWLDLVNQEQEAIKALARAKFGMLDDDWRFEQDITDWPCRPSQDELQDKVTYMFGQIHNAWIDPFVRATKARAAQAAVEIAVKHAKKLADAEALALTQAKRRATFVNVASLVSPTPVYVAAYGRCGVGYKVAPDGVNCVPEIGSAPTQKTSNLAQICGVGGVTAGALLLLWALAQRR